MSTKSMLREMTTQEAIHLWPVAEECLRAAVSQTEENPDAYMRQLQAKIFSGIHTLWAIEDNGEPAAYAVTALYTGDGIINIAQIYLAQGKALELFLQQWNQFVAWALRHDAHCVEVIGRKGWEKVLKPYGFKHNYTSLLRQITEELH